jgi:hypothetical protein
MVLPVLSLIHCGIGRLDFCAFASFCFVRNDLWDCARLHQYSAVLFSSCGFTYRHLVGGR